jgi:hypothetical protein
MEKIIDLNRILEYGVSSAGSDGFGLIHWFPFNPRLYFPADHPFHRGLMYYIVYCGMF